MDETTVLSRAHTQYCPRLFIINKFGQVQEYLLNGQVTQIGRSPELKSTDIQLNSSIASRIHGEFVQTEYGIYYRDLNSSNGTYINDYYYGKYSAATEKLLQDGDVLKIDGNQEYGTHPEAVIMIYRCTLVNSPQWQFVDLESSGMEIEIGRESMSGETGITDNRISRHHALFFVADEGWAVSDQNSTNGVFINNNRIQNAVYLKEMDCVQIVDNMFIYLEGKLIYSIDVQYNNGGKNITREDRLNTNELKVQTKSTIGKSLYINIVKRTVRQGIFKKKTLLQDINITVDAGEMVLILGGSGAGKTTFMNAVMGYEKATGSIRFGDTDIYSQYGKMKYDIGFVPQDVLLRENDTVYETLYNAAEMKMHRGTSSWDKKQRVMDVLEMVNLKHVAGSLVRSVSGGEKKRISAGVELVADPGLFFLDEPDSGLDAQSAMELMENLRQIADTGKIVMIISHSPDRAAHLFDKVIVLSKGSTDNTGHLTFFGGIEEAKTFFETNSLEGVVGKINGKNGQGDYFIEKWKQYSGREQ